MLIHGRRCNAVDNMFREFGLIYGLLDSKLLGSRQDNMGDVVDMDEMSQKDGG